MTNKINEYILMLDKNLRAPKTNKVHLTNGKVLKTPYMTSISGAIKYCEYYHIEYFKNI